MQSNNRKTLILIAIMVVAAGIILWFVFSQYDMKSRSDEATRERHEAINNTEKIHNDTGLIIQRLDDRANRSDNTFAKLLSGIENTTQKISNVTHNLTAQHKVILNAVSSKNVSQRSTQLNIIGNASSSNQKLDIVIALLKNLTNELHQGRQ